MSGKPEVIVFYWQGSPWASKVTTYLALRGIPFTECHQPITMPRPDLAALGVKYRRIPVVSIGRDVYCDTLLQLEKLEALFPTAKKGTLGGRTAEHKALEKLLEKWTDLAVFPNAADCIPLDHPLVQDPKFIQDRTELWGESWDRDERAKKRNAGLVQMKAFFDFLENDILNDGRDFILGTNEPMLADIHSAWIFDWMLQLPGSFPEDLISAKSHPKTFAWCDRYHKAVEAATPKQDPIDGKEALKRVSEADHAEGKGKVEGNDPLGLKQGQEVIVTPIDTGFTAQEKGKLDTLTSQEVAIISKAENGAEIRIHTPRWNFKIVPA